VRYFPCNRQSPNPSCISYDADELPDHADLAFIFRFEDDGGVVGVAGLDDAAAVGPPPAGVGISIVAGRHRGSSGVYNA